MENEKRHEKFTHLVEARTSEVLETIDLVGNLSNKYSYTYTEDGIEQFLMRFEKLAITTKRNLKPNAAKRAIKVLYKN